MKLMRDISTVKDSELLKNSNQRQQLYLPHPSLIGGFRAQQRAESSFRQLTQPGTTLELKMSQNKSLIVQK